MIKTIEIAPYMYARGLAEYIHSRVKQDSTITELREIILEYFLLGDET